MLLAATCALGAAPLGAQWRLDAQAGRLHYDAAPDAVTTTLALGLSRSTVLSGFGVAAGVPFREDQPVWGAVHGYRRLVAGRAVRYGIDLGADGFAYRIAARDSTPLLPLPDDEPETGWGGSLEAMPLLAIERGRFGLEARAGAVAFLSAASGAETIDRASFVADATLSATALPGLTARLDGRFVNAPEGGYPFAGLGFVWSGPVTLWGSAGRWFDDAVESLAWDAGGAVALSDRVGLNVSGRHAPIDPVYGTPARTTWGAGVSLLLGDHAATLPEPVPARYEDGVATIELAAADVSGTPSIAGDFNEWTPAPMERAGDAWHHRVALAPGVYNYAFVDEAGNWFVPEGTPGRRSDGMGGWVAVLVIAEAE